jgi:hypothetical protein
MVVGLFHEWHQACVSPGRHHQHALVQVSARLTPASHRLPAAHDRGFRRCRGCAAGLFFQEPLPLKLVSMVGRASGAGLVPSSGATARTGSGRLCGQGWVVTANPRSG